MSASTWAAVAPLVTVALAKAIADMPVIGFYARCFLGFVCLIGCAIYGIIASICLTLVGYGGLSQYTVARAFKYSMKLLVDVEMVLQDEHNLRTRPSVFISNHQSELDVLLCGEVFQPYTSVTAKKQLRYWPVLGWFMILSKTVFIDRANSKSARATFDGAARTMQTARQNVFIFPEGTRSYAAEPEMLPFKKGAFHLAVQAGVPIVPIVVANYSNVLSLQRKHFSGGRIPVRVLPPVETKGLMAADVDGLCKRVQEDMKRELVTLTEIARSQGTALNADDAKKERIKKTT